jgi:ubiquitin C-terminal hydrolase
MIDDNKIGCDVCGHKTDSLLGLRLKTLPNVLIVTLGRFEFDY